MPYVSPGMCFPDAKVQHSYASGISAPGVRTNRGEFFYKEMFTAASENYSTNSNVPKRSGTWVLRVSVGYHARNALFARSLRKRLSRQRVPAAHLSALRAL